MAISDSGWDLVRVWVPSTGYNTVQYGLNIRTSGSESALVSEHYIRWSMYICVAWVTEGAEDVAGLGIKSARARGSGVLHRQVWRSNCWKDGGLV